MKHEGSTFISGAAGYAGFFFFSKERDELAEIGSPNSSFFVYDEEDGEAEFRKYRENVSWPAVAMATIKLDAHGRLVVAVGPNGDYWELSPATTAEVVGRISGFQGNLRRLGVIEDSIYACGMGRVVLQRAGPGHWLPLGPGELKDDPVVVGFEALAGYSASELYAVGWSGEIWWSDHGKWRRTDSPTSHILTALCCSSTGMVYVVGHNGIMLKGRHDQWQLVETGRTENLKDVCVFDDHVFVTTDFEILKLGPNGLVVETAFADQDDKPGSCLHLLKAPDGVVSLGQKDVFVFCDGLWRRLV